MASLGYPETVKRAIALVVLLAAAAVGGALAYQAAARERDYRLQLSRGETALRDGKTFDALEAYTEAIALRPDSMLAYLRRGETYLQRPDLDAAAHDFVKAAAIDPSATRPLEDLGDVQYRRRRFEAAAEDYEARLRLDDRSADVAYKLALARYRDGDLDGALTALSQSLKLNDQVADAYYLRGMCLRDQQHLREALDAFEKAVALAPAAVLPREELADVYGALDRRADEIAQLQVLAALDQDRVERQVSLGLAHARAGHWDLAVVTLGDALARTPNEPLVYRALGQVWLDRPRDRNDRVYLSKAREALERVALSPTATSDVLAVYGRALLEDGDVDGAERTLRDAVTRYPVDESAFLEYATLAEKQTHFEAARRALVSYEAIVSEKPDSPGSPNFPSRAAHIASLSLRLNDAPTAVTWLQRAADATPNDLRALALLADAQFRAGDRTGAAATIARGLEKDPNNAALQALSQRR
jgi:tetratricopeptide (TPR) repeat protein